MAKVTGSLIYKKTVILFSCWPVLVLLAQAYFNEVIHHVERSKWARNRAANKQQRTKVFSPTYEGLNLKKCGYLAQLVREVVPVAPGSQVQSHMGPYKNLYNNLVIKPGTRSFPSCV